MNVGTQIGIGLDQSGFAPENLTTFAHFSVSSATYRPNSAGDPVISVAPMSANRAFMAGSARIAPIVALSLVMISAVVVPGGADAVPRARLALSCKHLQDVAT